MAEKKTVFETPWFSIESEEYDLPALKGKPIYRINAPDSVVVVALTKNKELVLIRHFRPACNSWMLEFPAGKIDEGEQPADTARRELLEETGYACSRFIYLGIARIGADRVNSFVHVLYGADASRVPDRVPERGVEVFVTPLSEFRDKVIFGEFHQLAALGCLLIAYWRGYVDLP